MRAPGTESTTCGLRPQVVTGKVSACLGLSVCLSVTLCVPHQCPLPGEPDVRPEGAPDRESGDGGVRSVDWVT